MRREVKSHEKWKNKQTVQCLSIPYFRQFRILDSLPYVRAYGCRTVERTVARNPRIGLYLPYIRDLEFSFATKRYDVNIVIYNLSDE